MSHRLRQASLHVIEGTSLVVPVIVEDLPESIEALARRWQRKRELHMTAVSAAVIEAAGQGRPGIWDTVTLVASGRQLGPIVARDEVRRVRNPDKPDLETLIVMVECAGLASLHRDLSAALGVMFEPPPAHVTVFSSDPAQGIGIDNEQELRERAPELGAEQQDEVRRAMRFDQVLWDDQGVPAAAAGESPCLPLGNTDPVFTPAVLSALAYADHVHRDQRRKGTATPYLAHLLAVAALVGEDGGGETEVIAALLHDTAEDHGGESRLRDINRRFGPEVEAIVLQLSDPPGEQWRERKQRYLARLREERSASVLRVCNADKLHNARAILADRRMLGDAVWERIGHSPADVRWYYGELASILGALRPGSMLSAELTETVAQLRREICR